MRGSFALTVIHHFWDAKDLFEGAPKMLQTQPRILQVLAELLEAAPAKCLQEGPTCAYSRGPGENSQPKYNTSIIGGLVGLYAGQEERELGLRSPRACLGARKLSNVDLKLQWYKYFS